MFGNSGGNTSYLGSNKYSYNKSNPITLKRVTRTINSFIQKILNDKKTRNVFYFLVLNLSFTMVEALYGIWTNSLGLTSDAIHMLFDSTAILLSLSASVVAKWDSNENYTYGYGRVETITGFVNGTALFMAGLKIVWESFERFYEPAEIIKDKLLIVAVLGFLVNMVGIFAFDHGHVHHHHGHDHDHHHGHGHHHHGHDHGSSNNPLMQGMFLHILADTLGSVGVITSSILIELYGWTCADPVCSLFIAVMILMSVWPLLQSSAMVLLQRVPTSVESKSREALHKIMDIPNVISYHSVHFWELSSGVYVGTACVRISMVGDDQKVRVLVSDLFRRVVGCKHVVVQVEKEGFDDNSVGGLQHTTSGSYNLPDYATATNHHHGHGHHDGGHGHDHHSHDGGHGGNDHHSHDGGHGHNGGGLFGNHQSSSNVFGYNNNSNNDGSRYSQQHTDIFTPPPQPQHSYHQMQQQSQQRAPFTFTSNTSGNSMGDNHIQQQQQSQQRVPFNFSSTGGGNSFASTKKD